MRFEVYEVAAATVAMLVLVDEGATDLTVAGWAKVVAKAVIWAGSVVGSDKTAVVAVAVAEALETAVAVRAEEQAAVVEKAAGTLDSPCTCSARSLLLDY